VYDIGPAFGKGRPEDEAALRGLVHESGRPRLEVLVDLEARQYVVVIDDCPGCGTPWDGHGAKVLVAELARHRAASADDVEDHVLEAWLDGPPFNEGRAVVWDCAPHRHCSGCREI
jgi:hypothetical protein